MSGKPVALPNAAAALAVLLICRLTTSDCTAQSAISPESLSVEIRSAILSSQFSHQPGLLLVNEAMPLLTAQGCIRNHGAEAFRTALLVLLHDPDSNVRETAAKAALFYGLPPGDLADAIGDMLNDSDTGVNLVGLKMASDARLSPELVVRIAFTPDHPFRQDAIQSLRSFLCARPPQPAAQRAVIMLLSRNSVPDAVGATLEMLEMLGPMARFAEDAVANRLADRRDYFLHQFSHTEPTHYVSVQSMKVLRALGVVSEKTQSRVFEIVNDSQRGPSIELLEESELLLWGESALAAVVLNHNEAPIHHFIDALMSLDLDNGRRMRLPYFTEELLRTSPTAMTRWGSGREIVDSMIADRVERSFSPHWRVVSRWPQAAEVFKPQVLAYFRDGFSEAHATCFSLVCRIADEDGLTLEEAEAIVEYAVQSPSQSHEIRSMFVEFSHDGEAFEMLLAALSVAEATEDSVKRSRSLELKELRFSAK